MKPQIQRQPTPDLVKLCLGILENIIKVENPMEVFLVMRARNDNGNLYRGKDIVKIRGECAFCMRNLNHVRDYGRKISYPVLADLLGYRCHSSVMYAIKKLDIYADEVTQEDTQTLEYTVRVDKMIQEIERRRAAGEQVPKVEF